MAIFFIWFRSNHVIIGRLLGGSVGVFYRLLLIKFAASASSIIHEKNVVGVGRILEILFSLI